MFVKIENKIINTDNITAIFPDKSQYYNTRICFIDGRDSIFKSTFDEIAKIIEVK